MATCDKVVPYIDLPLQHAADGVLKRMRRPGSRASYERLLARPARRGCPSVTLRTTFIVGFPGETEADFEELLRLRQGRRVRPRRRLHLLARGRHGGARPGRRRARPRTKAAPAAQADGAAEEDRRRAGSARRHRRAGPGAGGRPVARARAGLDGPAGRAGAGDRSDGLPHRRRPRSPPSGRL